MASFGGQRTEGRRAAPVLRLAGEDVDAAPMFAPVAKLPVLSGDSPLPASAPEGIALAAEAPPDIRGEPVDAVLPLVAGTDGVALVTAPEFVTVFVPDGTVDPVIIAVVAPVVNALLAAPGVALV